MSAPRSLVKYQEPIEEIDLHTFGDASGQGVAATVVAVVRQASGNSKGLVASKSRLAKKNLTIPRLELVSAHMASNLVDNVQQALEGFPVKRVFGWLDSTVALHWIRGNGEFESGETVCVRSEKRIIFNGDTFPAKIIQLTSEAEEDTSITQTASGGKVQTG